MHPGRGPRRRQTGRRRVKPLSILILDDEERLASELAEYLITAGHRALTADRPSAAFSLIETERVDVAIVDIKLPEYDGLEFIRRLRERKPEIETIVMSGHGDMNNVIEAFRLGAFDYLRKPFASFDLQTALSRTRKYLAVQEESRRYAELCASLNRELAGEGDFIGSSPVMERVRERIALAADHSSSPVLILGESGTGKELAARRIHTSSSRSSGRFVAVNCAAIPREMFESEFFGHERGAFTDARIARAGLFRAADGGTLFLDEIADMPMEAQSKLLRVIEGGSVRPVGADRELTVDVRIVCATNNDLSVAVHEGRFRRDLYYRLAVIELRLPPLRERGEDIIALAAYFLSRYSRSGAVPALSHAFREKLLSYPFPGNVRELRNLMERAAIRGGTVADFDPADWPRGGSAPALTEADAHADLNLDALERRAVSAALDRAKGVRTEAARLLGITRQALDRRLERHSLK